MDLLKMSWGFLAFFPYLRNQQNAKFSTIRSKPEQQEANVSNKKKIEKIIYLI